MLYLCLVDDPATGRSRGWKRFARARRRRLAVFVAFPGNLVVRVVGGGRLLQRDNGVVRVDGGTCGRVCVGGSGIEFARKLTKPPRPPRAPCVTCFRTGTREIRGRFRVLAEVCRPEDGSTGPDEQSEPVDYAKPFIFFWGGRGQYSNLKALKRNEYFQLF